MRNYLSLFFLMLFFTSCDDGDIIITTFDFEGERFEMCSNERSKVLYHINNAEVFETITIRMRNNSFSSENTRLVTVPTSIRLPLEGNTIQNITIQLTGDEEIIYRTYDGEVPANYFCQDIPPSTPRVLQEYRSVGGNIVIRTNPVYNMTSGRLDHDGDGIPSSEEMGRDTDGDGIPDYLDIDDDGDNVRTRDEIVTNPDDPTTNGYRDTDEDGVPNYLDPDDDGDGVPTRYEVTENQFDPRLNTNSDGIPWFLDSSVANRYSGEVPDLFENTIPIGYESIIEAQNLKLRNTGGDGEEISFISLDLGIFRVTNISTLIIPADGEIVEEEDEDEDEEEEGNEG